MSTISRGDIITRIRTAIDDILPNVEDSFSANTDAEMWQAAQDAAIELSMELPINLLDVSESHDAGNLSGNVSEQTGSILLPENYLRFISLSVGGWTSTLRNLMEPDGEEEKMQRSAWTRGTVSKPKAVLNFNSLGKRQLTFWPTGDSYILEYVAVPKVENDTITCSLRAEAVRLLAWRAASIFFEGKKEEQIAEKFRNLSTNY